MSRQTIYDRNYQTLGYIEDDNDRATAYDRNWQTIAEGNVLSALIYNAQ